ncbi:MAG: hypothetical protein KGJ23_10090 [Euryarchaeota archaeon]|nr:hypothetical protein [Euryarchaeota archaeon]MDE1836954.1 hypothetical protein [Euryarchaeota archaeon]MDE1881928.1 hypothetical protein [Euryarchaeota archaeon]MDE2045861.1 hypothetical protein [Thermoplasmata archaeon]
MTLTLPAKCDECGASTEVSVTIGYQGRLRPGWLMLRDGGGVGAHAGVVWCSKECQRKGLARRRVMEGPPAADRA